MAVVEKGEKMPRLIDADKTIGHIKTRLLETALNNATVVCDVSYIYQDCADNRIETWIDEMPTVDAEPVVRCKECQHWHESIFLRGEQGQRVGLCDCTMSMRDTDFFCKEGRKERRWLT